MEMKHVNNSTYPSLISNTDDVCILNIKKWNVSIYIGKKFQERQFRSFPLRTFIARTTISTLMTVTTFLTKKTWGQCIPL
jgi:hypothetical protein